MVNRPFAWEKSYPPGVVWDIRLLPSTIPAMFDAAVAGNGPRPAISCQGHAMTYAELGSAVDRAARSLLARGFGPGTSVALYLPNTPWHPIAFFGALKAGARVVHLSPLDSERTIRHKLADSGARVMVTLNVAPLLDMATGLLQSKALDWVVPCGPDDWTIAARTPAALTDGAHYLSFDAPVDPACRLPAVAPDDIALLQYTGGTTGVPKGAMLTHGNLMAALQMYEAWYGGQGVVRRGSERIICALPLFHIFALTTILLKQVANGNEILLHPRFDVAAILADIEVGRATSFAGVPTMWIALANHPGIEQRDFSSLEVCTSGGAPLPVDVHNRVERIIGRRLGGGWGMTETCPAGTLIPISARTKSGTIGLPLPGIEMDVVSLDDATRVLAPGETGELRIKGPNVTRGYWGHPDASVAAFSDGRFLTGDVGYMDRDGFFFLVDRKSDLIISGGFNVYPAMIEQAIYEHPSVAEAAVIGIPDDYRGEAAKAFITRRPGAPAFTLDELRAFLAGKVGRHEMPSALEFRDSLPRTPVGKLSRLELRREERERQTEQPPPMLP